MEEARTKAPTAASTSQLEKLLRESTKYSRLNQLPTPGTDKTFSVRAQSDDNEGTKQTTAANFMDGPVKRTPGDTGKVDEFQQEFTVNQAKNSLSITGRRKGEGASYTKYTDKAKDYYDVLVEDMNLNKYKSKLVHKYLQNKAETHYKQINTATAGVVLVYNPA